MLNRRKLPPEIRVRAVPGRDTRMVPLFFGTLAAITIYTQIKPFIS